MYTVRENNIADNTVKIPMCIIQEFGCADGWIGIVQYGRFALLADGHIAEGEDIYAQRSPRTNPSPTSPRKLADVDWDSSKINPNKIRAESWPGAAFGPYRLLTERLRYETTPLLPSLRDRVHVHGQCDVTYASHRRSHAASGNSRATGASRRHEQHILTRLLPT